MKTWRAIVALIATTAGLGLATPATAAAPPTPKTLVVVATPATSVWSQPVRLTATITPRW